MWRRSLQLKCTGPYYAYLIQWSWSVAWEMLDELSFSLMRLCACHHVDAYLKPCYWKVTTIFTIQMLDELLFGLMTLCGSCYAYLIPWSWNVAREILDELSFILMTLCACHHVDAYLKPWYWNVNTKITVGWYFVVLTMHMLGDNNVGRYMQDEYGHDLLEESNYEQR